MVVAAGFERLWERAQGIEARRKYLADCENEQLERKIDELQRASRDALTRLRGKERERRLKRVNERLDEIGRRLSLPLKRPKGQQARVRAVVVRWARLKYPDRAITGRRLDDWVIEHRNLVRDSRLQEEALRSLVGAGYGPTE
jgi:hypothetical protein